MFSKNLLKSLVTNNQAKKAYKLFTGRTPEGQENLMLGAAAGMTAAVIMTPIDVVKTRLMTQAAVAGKEPYKGAARRGTRPRTLRCLRLDASMSAQASWTA